MEDDMRKFLTDEQVRALNNSDPYNQFFKIGTLIQNLQKYCQYLEQNSGGGGGGGVSSVNNRTGAVTLDKSDVGLSNADNTADNAKPVSTAQQAAIDAEAQRAQQAESGIAGNLTAESQARASADTGLQNAIQTEIGNRQTAITSGVNEAKSYADSLFANVNTAEFAGPYNAVANIPTPYDTNDLYLVGTAEPYDIYAYIQGQLKKIGSSNVDLSGYYNKTDIDAFLGGKINNPAPSGQSMDGNIPTLNANGDGLVNSGKKIADFATAGQGTKADNAATAADLNAHTGNSNIHVTAAEKSAWNSKQNALTFPLSVPQGGTGLSSIPQYSVLAASGNNALIAYRRGGLGVFSHASISNEYKNFTNLITRTSMSFLQDAADAQVEFTGFMKTITANQYDDALGILKIRWSELVYTGGSVDLTSSGIVINATDLIKSFFPAITANSIGYNNITLMPGAVGTCGRVTAYNQQGVKGNPIFGGGVLFYDPADGLKVSGVITSDNSAILVWEMEFPVAVTWVAADCAVFAEI